MIQDLSQARGKRQCKGKVECIYGGVDLNFRGLLQFHDEDRRDP